MAEWPTALPAPQKQLSFSPGSNLVRRKLQSGRVEVRRMGSRAPGKIEAVFRLRADQLGAFEYFYERNLCLGVNWFTANWLNTGDKARFSGHPRTLGRLGEYFDVAATLLLVDELDWTPEDVLWPTGGTGGGETPPVAEGNVVGWGAAGATYAHSCIPAGLVAKKVVIVNGGLVGVALKSDGTLAAWAYNSANLTTYVPGYAALGGIADIAGTQYGLLYLTTSGGIGYIGQGGGANFTIDTTYPTISDGLKIMADGLGNARACVFRSGNVIQQWGYNSSGALNSFTSPTAAEIRDYHANLYFQSCVDANGVLNVAGYSHQRVANMAGVECCGGSGYSSATYARTYAYKTDGTWYKYPAAALAPVPGLVPTKILSSPFEGFRMFVGIHTDGTPVAWSAYSGSTGHKTAFDAAMPSGMKILDGALYLVNTTNGFVFLGIQKS